MKHEVRLSALKGLFVKNAPKALRVVLVVVLRGSLYRGVRLSRRGRDKVIVYPIVKLLVSEFFVFFAKCFGCESSASFFKGT